MSLVEKQAQRYRSLKKIGKIFGFLVILYIAYSVGVASASSPVEQYIDKPNITSIDKPNIILDKINTKELINVSYDELLRNNELYIGKSIIDSGVIVSSNYDTDTYIIGTKYDGFTWWNNEFYVDYGERRFLDGDKVEFEGTMTGIKEFYDIPEIEIYYIGLTN